MDVCSCGRCGVAFWLFLFFFLTFFLGCVSAGGVCLVLFVGVLAYWVVRVLGVAVA